MAKMVNRMVQWLEAVTASKTMSNWGGTLMPPYLELASIEVNVDVELLASMLGDTGGLPKSRSVGVLWCADV